MKATVIVPTFRRPEKLANCLKALSRQSLDPSLFEVIVTVDGHEPRTRAAATDAWAAMRADPERLSVLEGDHGGPCLSRNRAIEQSTGDILVFFNDDVVPAETCVAAHVEAHQQLSGRRAIVVGDSPWRIHHPDHLFARMLRETSMVFFHDRMRDSNDPDRDWGFRHAWLLNLSTPASAVREVGGLRQIQSTYGRDDDELAFRLTRTLGLPVLYRPQAVVEHDHVMTPREYLRREYELGFGAPSFAAGAPECAREMFGRDVLAPATLNQTRRELDLHRPSPQLLAWFVDSAHQPAITTPQEVATAYERHLPLKRWVWRQGLLDALEGRAQSADETVDSLTRRRAAA